MFDWLKRRGATPAKAERPRGPARAPAPGMPVKAGKPAAPRVRAADPPPLPEVVAEGNTEADWSAWEDSKTALDSQMQGLMPSTQVYVRDTRPSQLEDADPFANVGRKRDL